MSPGHSRIQWLLFAASLLAFGWFHQGGGWNQNARFALVRAIVEEGSLSIDSHLVYAAAPSDGGSRLVRVPVRNGRFEVAGRQYAFTWGDTGGRVLPIADPLGGNPRPGDVSLVRPADVACTGDVAFHAGRFHPAKAPGGALVAVSAYALLRGIERAAGADPDDWWTLTLNVWLTSALSVGLLSALGCVIFFRLALALSGGRARESLLATLTFAFGTMFLPYGTSLYEHNVVAVALLASFALLHRLKEAGAAPEASLPEGWARAHLVAAGACAGAAAVANYAMAVVVLLLGAYLALAVRRPGGLRWFALGVLGPFLLLCAHNVAAFSNPFTTNYAHEDPAFRSGGEAFLGVFGLPSPGALVALLLSPFRGLLLGSPVLLLGVYGLARWAREPGRRAEAWLVVSVLGFFLLFVSSFNGWHGGWAVGPRYLAPALPFLALPLVVGFVRLPRTTSLLAAVSVAVTVLVTAVDPQAPVGIAPHATVGDRPTWMHSPVAEYVWPLFSGGRAWPILSAQRDEVLAAHDRAMRDAGQPDSVRREALALLAAEIDSAIRAGQPAPLLLVTGPGGERGVGFSVLPTVEGPVSANPVGVYEGWAHRVFPPGSEQARWNSFNAGELVLGRSRLSLAPLLLVLLGSAIVALRWASRLDASQESERRPTSQPATTNR